LSLIAISPTFSMELALEIAMPIYSGGLRVLAGDVLRSAADVDVLMVAASLLYRSMAVTDRS
jgi:glycogen phosphorylase